MKNKAKTKTINKVSCPKCGSSGQLFTLHLEEFCDKCAKKFGTSFRAVIEEFCSDCGHFIHEANPTEDLIDLFNQELEAVEVIDE